MAIADKLLVCPSCRRRYDEPTPFCVDCGTRLLNASAESAALPGGETPPAESGLPQTAHPAVEGQGQGATTCRPMHSRPSRR